MLWRSLLAITLLVGCSDDAASDPAGSDAGTEAGSDAGGCETYTAGMSKPGKDGKLVFTLVDSNPAPPQVGNNRWTLSITDTSGGAVAGASVTVVPWMPEHRHGSSTQAVVTDGGDGSYVLDPVNFMMPGVWETTIEASAQAGTDSAMFAFCIGQ